MLLLTYWGTYHWKQAGFEPQTLGSAATRSAVSATLLPFCSVFFRQCFFEARINQSLIIITTSTLIITLLVCIFHCFLTSIKVWFLKRNWFAFYFVCLFKIKGWVAAEDTFADLAIFRVSILIIFKYFFVIFYKIFGYFRRFSLFLRKYLFYTYLSLPGLASSAQRETICFVYCFQRGPKFNSSSTPTLFGCI